MPGALSPFRAAEPTVCLELYRCFVGPHHVREIAIRLVQILPREGQTLHLVLLTNHLAVRTASERPAQGRTAAEDCRRRNVVPVGAEKGMELDGRGLIVAAHLAALYQWCYRRRSTAPWLPFQGPCILDPTEKLRYALRGCA